MIERLFIDKRSDGGYDVVCNDLFTAVEGYSTVGIAELVGEAFEVLTDLYRDECNADDITNSIAGSHAVLTAVEECVALIISLTTSLIYVILRA